jgi:hypothetical protein
MQCCAKDCKRERYLDFFVCDEHFDYVIHHSTRYYIVLGEEQQRILTLYPIGEPNYEH